MARWQHVPDDFQARLIELAELFAKSRDVLFEVQGEFHGAPAAESLAMLDLESNEEGPGGPWGDRPVQQTIYVVANYLLVAGGHLGGLSALYAAAEVLFSPPTLVRSVIENCARVVRVLTVDDRDDTRARVCRAYLEEFFSAEQSKMVAGRLGSKPGEAFKDAQAAYIELRDTILPSIFNDVSRETLGAKPKTLETEALLGPEECVLWMYEQVRKLGTGIDDRQAKGVYGLLCNMTHPTLYPVRQMTGWFQPTQQDHLESYLSIDLPFLEKLASAAVLGYYNATSLFFSYMGWNPASFSTWESAIDEVLPGSLVDAEVVS